MNRKLHHFLAAALAAAACSVVAPPLYAQAETTDITADYLQNAGFETTPTGIGADNTVYDVPGWTETPAAGSNEFYKLGTIPYGEENAVLAITPENGSSVSENNTAVLAIKQHWNPDATLAVSQSADLPAGTYRLSFDTWVGQTLENAASRCGYIIGGTETYTDALADEVGVWKQNAMTFTLTEAGEVTFSFGYLKTANSGGGDSPILLVDNVKLESVALPTFTYGWIRKDVTNLITNPSFEENQGDRQTTIPGWTKAGPENNEFCTRNDAAGRIPTYGDGNVYLQYWVSNTLPDFSVTQTLDDLPNGKYRIIAAASFTGTEGYYLIANEDSIAIGEAGEYLVETEVTDGSLTFGVTTDGANGNFAKADYFRLYQYENNTLDDVLARLEASPAHSQASAADLTAAVDALQLLLTDAEATEEAIAEAAEAVATALEYLYLSEQAFAAFRAEIDRLTEESAAYSEFSGYAAYQEALKAAEEAYASGTDELPKAIVALYDAEKACRLTDPSGEATFLIENPDFDENAEGWTTTTGAQNAGISSNKKTGTFETTLPHYENWNPTGMIGTMSQTITEIPNGKYILSIDAFRDQEPSSGANIPADDTRAGVYAFANADKTPVLSSTPQTYTVETIVTDGTLTIGIESAEAVARWIGFDNVKLRFLGDLNPAPAEPSTAIDESSTYYIYHPAADKFMANNADATNGALYAMGSIEDEDAYKWEITLAPGADESAPDTVSLKQLSSGKYLNALSTNGWSMGLGDYDATGSRYIVNDAEGTYTLSNVRNTSKMIGFDNLNDGSTPYYDKGTGNNPYFKFYKVDEYEEYALLLPYYRQKETLRERINEMKALQDGLLGGYHSEEDEEGLAATLAYALEIYEQTADAVALDSLTAAVGIVDDAIEVYKYSTMATADNPADFTFAIANADGELCSWHSIPGWTMDPASIGNWGGKAVDNDVLTGQSIELWNPSGSPFTVSLTQSLAGLPDGKYSLTLGAFAADQANGTTTGALYFFAGNFKADLQVSNPAGTDDEVVGAAQQYTIEDIYVSGGTLELGIRAEASNANWFGFDNVTLTYYGPKETLLVLTDSVTRTTDMGYTATFVDNHSAEICDFLLVDSLADESVTISPMNADGTLVENTTDGWFNAEGNLQAWGSDARVCVKYPADQYVLNAQEYFICTMPDVCEAGDVYTTQWAVMTATDTVVLRTVVTMAEPEVPEILTPAQCTNLGTVQIKAEAEADATGANTQEVTLDVEEVAAYFDMDVETFSETAAFYATARDSFALSPTANQGGYWLDANGEAIAWGTGAVFYLEPLTAKDYSTFHIGQFGGACAAGDEYQATLYFVIGDEMVTLEVTYTIADDPTGIEETTAGAEPVATEYYTLDGIRIDSPAQGTYVEKVTYSDGSVKSQVIIRE